MPHRFAGAGAHLEALRQRCRNTDIDWERLLEFNYTALLSDLPAPPGILDIGGHAGRHARIFVAPPIAAGHLVIFEPLPAQSAELEKTFLLQANIKVVACALGNRRGSAGFILKTGSPEESGLKPRVSYNNGRHDDLREIVVRIAPLDDFHIPFQVDYIKIDTEGGEIDILKGGAGLLRRDRPIVSVEYGPSGFAAYGYRPETLYDLAEDYGYDLFDLFGHRFASREEWCGCVGRFYWDYLMVPRDRLPALAGRIEAISGGAAAFTAG